MQTMHGCSEKENAEEFIEPDYGRKHFEPPTPQSSKKCEECIHFEKSLVSDEPCGLCYESTDKYNWSDKHGSGEPGEMEYPTGRVCEDCTEGY